MFSLFNYGKLKTIESETLATVVSPELLPLYDWRAVEYGRW